MPQFATLYVGPSLPPNRSVFPISKNTKRASLLLILSFLIAPSPLLLFYLALRVCVGLLHTNPVENLQALERVPVPGG